MLRTLQNCIAHAPCQRGLARCQPTCMAKSYEDAVSALNSLQSNAATIEKIRIAQDGLRHKSLPDMILMAERAGITLIDIDKLSVIHVSGTKGKGSTCAFTESILRSLGFRTGFYSSPHLVEVRERIRINGRPISHDDFSKHFWHCYQLLDESKAAHDGAMPPYFRFLTIMAFHVFLQEKVDVAIIEVGIGGEYDCTNIVRNPVVCGVTSLGIDHTSILGDTIDKIAWHKAGIFKPNVPAVTVPQPEAAMEVLRSRAKEINNPLFVSPSLDSYDWNGHRVELGIPGVHQALNASLALQLCQFWLKDRCFDIAERQNSYRTQDGRNNMSIAKHFPVSAEMAAGLHSCLWPARNQKLSGPGVTYYIDGAHTPESLQLCSDWFIDAAAKEAQALSGRRVIRILLFNMTGDRNPDTLLRCLMPCNFDCAIFCPNIQSLSSGKSDLTNLTVAAKTQIQRCEENRNVWLRLASEPHSKDSTTPNGTIPEAAPMPTVVFSNIFESLVFVSRGKDPRLVENDGKLKIEEVDGMLLPSIEFADHVQVLCAGSLHLVGGILSFLNPNVCDAPSQ